ncbi:PREDICTED: interferon-induced GTP-binding protein Mx2-like [Nanorana parkeri]|uniref:interferon-induced GTP-binding protein Mx2-like n=1 Tax=Nanorana parkeri TaxID=125878 RepID=UPI00085425D1|nr:PREDICTED: interferon-induced GTP-binding protein Mx2-like [Nanorana parkeri]
MRMYQLNNLSLESGWGKRGEIETAQVIMRGKVSETVRSLHQNIIAGTNHGISDELITLEIVSPDVPDLTLIDLPGITRIAMPNQPEDIGKQIKLMIKKYISRQETINLAVVPCNVDVATTEALEMAREVDPTGNRTIGILTKPDLIDRGTEMQLLRTVQNQVYPLTKGYMTVKCRAQLEIQENISLQEALENEKAFFENHQHFRALLEDGLATIPNLAERLTKELVIHIARTLPNIICQINTKLREAEDKLNLIGRGLPDSEDDKILFLVKISTAHAPAPSSCPAVREASDLQTRASSGDSVVHELKKDKNIYDNQYRGRELYGFINYKRFENILEKQILSIQEPAIKILHEISNLSARLGCDYGSAELKHKHM